MHGFAYAAFAAMSNKVQPVPVVENHHFVLKFIGCTILAILLRMLWSALDKGPQAIGMLFAWIPMVGCLLFIGLAVYNLICWRTAGEPNSGPPTGLGG